MTNRCSITITISGMEIQMRMSCHLTPARMANTEKKRAASSGEDVKKGEFSHISGKVNACISVERVGSFLHMPETEMPYDLRVLQLDTYRKNVKSLLPKRHLCHHHIYSNTVHSS